MIGDTGAYTVINNQVDLGLRGSCPYIVQVLAPGGVPNVGSWFGRNNSSPQKSVLPYDFTGAAPLPEFWWESTRKITVGTRPPIAGEGTWSTGYEIRNLVPSRFSAIRGWLCVASGDPGTWISIGAVGVGTTANRNSISSSLSQSDRIFFDNTETRTLEFWNGASWKTVASIL
jgi:hypothetical protein